ncbi:MAG: TetR/AcrR family transcriptional regulator [Roseovarius sp.]
MARTVARDHGAKRAQILKSAARVFAAEGFDRASMTQLARACGISKANVYHYYDSKDALLFDILETYLRGLRDRICGLALAGLTPEERLRVTLREILIAYQGSDDEHRVQMAGLDRLPEAQRRLLRGYQGDLVRHLSAILAALAPAALAHDPARLRAVTMSVFGMLNWHFMWTRGADARAREEYAALVADLTLGGIRGLVPRAATGATVATGVTGVTEGSARTRAQAIRGKAR